MARLAVVGAGVMGLAAAFQAAQDGIEVEVFEADAQPGGMAAHFDFGGLSVERFCHFVCRADEPTFRLLGALGMTDRLRWRTTTMGYFIDGRLHRWGDPLSLLRFPGLGPLAKLRYGLLMFLAMRRGPWDALEHQSAHDWIARWCGRDVYERLWRRLFELKFHEHADEVSAAWIRTRIRRIGRSRRSLLHEELGYIEGGSGALVDALVAAIRVRGGTVRLAAPVAEVLAEGGRVRGVRLRDGTRRAADHVISTVPTALVGRMVPALPEEWRRRYDAIRNIGVASVVLKLRRPVTPHFWVNVVDPALAVPGLIELTNLQPLGGRTIVYVPSYMPETNPRWAWPDDALADEAFAVLKRINPALTDEDRIGVHVGRLRHAQPICPPGFSRAIPPVQTPIAGLQVADTSFYYPEDRGIAESVRLGRDMAVAVSGGPPAATLPEAFRRRRAA